MYVCNSMSSDVLITRVLDVIVNSYANIVKILKEERS